MHISGGPCIFHPYIRTPGFVGGNRCMHVLREISVGGCSGGWFDICYAHDIESHGPVVFLNNRVRYGVLTLGYKL